jgi:hypothetical protein
MTRSTYEQPLGALPDEYKWAGSKQRTTLTETVDWGREKFLRLCGLPTIYAYTLGEWLEAVTSGEPVVEGRRVRRL